MREMSARKSAVLGGLPKAAAATGDLAPERTPERGPAGERVSLHGWTLEVEFNDHPSLPWLTTLAHSLTHSLTGGSCSKSHIRLQRPCFRGQERRGEERRGEERRGPRWATSRRPTVGRDRGGQIVPRGRNPANEGGRVVGAALPSACRNCFITRIL